MDDHSADREGRFSSQPVLITWWNAIWWFPQLPLAILFGVLALMNNGWTGTVLFASLAVIGVVMTVGRMWRWFHPPGR